MDSEHGGGDRQAAPWRLRFAEMTCDAVHPAGIKHQAAVTPSRLETTGQDQTLLDDDLYLLALVLDGERGITYTLDAQDGCINVSHGEMRCN